MRLDIIYPPFKPCNCILKRGISLTDIMELTCFFWIGSKQGVKLSYAFFVSMLFLFEFCESDSVNEFL